jgi:hypothetical protein
MIVLDRKKPISALKLIHTFNHTQTNRFCNINNDHINIINTLEYTIDERIYDLKAGLYKIIIDNTEYIIDIYYDLSNGDFLVIKNKDTITLYMAGSTPYPIVPYKINNIYNDKSEYTIDSVNDSIDITIISGNTNYAGNPSLNSPAKINRSAGININTKFGEKYNSLNISFKYTLGKLPNGVKDYIIINSDQLIAHNIINTSKEVLSGGLNWEYKQEYSNSEYYVFFTEYPRVKSNNTSDCIRCSHFEPVAYNELLSTSTKKNCIAVSDDSHNNGIWLKIAVFVLDIHGDKNISDEMKKWIRIQSASENPICIEYQLTDTMYNTILIDEYHMTTWYPNTTITFNSDYDVSVFYKALKL